MIAQRIAGAARRGARRCILNWRQLPYGGLQRVGSERQQLLFVREMPHFEQAARIRDICWTRLNLELLQTALLEHDPD